MSARGGCAALYSYEYVDAAQEVITRFLLPRLFAAGEATAGRSLT